MSRKLVPVVLSIIMMVSIFITGCGNKNSAGAGDTQKAPSTDNTPVSSYPITDKPITLKVWAPLHPNATQYIQSFAENEAYQEMEKRTGIHIEWTHPTIGQEKEAFNLMMASGDLPDIIITADKYQGGVTAGVKDGVFEDLTPYMDKYAPDYMKLINSDPEVKREATTDDGKFNAFYTIKPKPDVPWRRIMFREDMLKAVNMDIPKTIPDYEKVLKAIKDAKGFAPYILMNKGVEKQFVGPFGILDAFYLNQQGKVAYGKTQPEFKEYLTLMNKWYSEGLINKDFAGLKTPQINALFDSGKAAMIVESVDGTYSRGERLGNSYVPAPFPRVKSPTDKIHYQPAQWPRGGNVTVVTTSSKHKIEAIRWLNYAYTQAGSMLLNYGVEGKTYNMVNGVPEYTDYMLHNPKFPTQSANYILKVHFAPKIQCRDVDCNPNILISPKGKTMRLKWSDDPNVDSAMYIPPISLTPDEATKRGKIMTDADTYSDEMVLKFIMGAEPLSNFDQYVAQMKKFGIDDAVKITQTAYDRYVSKK